MKPVPLVSEGLQKLSSRENRARLRPLQRMHLRKGEWHQRQPVAGPSTQPTRGKRGTVAACVPATARSEPGGQLAHLRQLRAHCRPVAHRFAQLHICRLRYARGGLSALLASRQSKFRLRGSMAAPVGSGGCYRSSSSSRLSRWLPPALLGTGRTSAASCRKRTRHPTRTHPAQAAPHLELVVLLLQAEARLQELALCRLELHVALRHCLLEGRHLRILLPATADRRDGWASEGARNDSTACVTKRMPSVRCCSKQSTIRHCGPLQTTRPLHQHQVQHQQHSISSPHASWVRRPLISSCCSCTCR